MQKTKTLDIPDSDFISGSVVLGIDEAGRGPVLGPMVYACAYWDKCNQEKISNFFKFDDSKKLTEKVREEIYEKMSKYKSILDYEAIVIHPEELSNKMLKREKISLNKISTDAAVQLIRNAINRGINVREVYVDTVGKPETYQMMLENKFSDNGITFKVSAKADSLFPSVSAASIVAKVTRDSEVNNWIFKEDTSNIIFDKNYGCGYPGDPITKKWMENTLDPIFGYPSIVRFSWKTASEKIKVNGKSVKWENYSDEEDEGKKRVPFISQNKKIEFTTCLNKKRFNYLDKNQISINNIKFFK